MTLSNKEHSLPPTPKELSDEFQWTPDLFRVIVEFASTKWNGEPQRDQADRLYRTVKQAFSVIQGHQGPIRYLAPKTSHSPVEYRDLKQETDDCLSYIARRCEWRTPKPKQLTLNQWVIWNLAPFFTHTARTATLHVGDIGRLHFAHFLLLVFGKNVQGDALRKTYERAKTVEEKMGKDLPRETVLAYHIDKLNRRRRKHHPRSFSTILHEEAYKDLTFIRHND